MTIVNVGLVEMANQMKNVIATGELGTGTTLQTNADTSLETPVAATDKAVTSTSAGTSFTLTHSITSGEANGNTFTEFGLKYSDGTLFNRTTFSGLVKDNTSDVTILTTINVNRSG